MGRAGPLKVEISSLRFSMRQRPWANSDFCEPMRPIDKMLGAFLQLGRVLITRTAFS